MQNQFQKAINLARITGDRIIVVDSSKPEDVFVIMNLEEYEKFVLGQSDLRSLTEEELLDKINRDVAIWKSENTENYEVNSIFSEKKEKNDGEEDSLYYYPDPVLNKTEWEEDSEEDYSEEEEDEKPKNHWAIPGSVKNSAEEVIEDIPF